MAVRAVLFDFDGTLVQTRDSSWAVFQETNRQFELGIDRQADFFRLLEDNFFKSLREVCGDDGKAERAGRHFLQALQRDYRPPFVPGMVDVVRAMAGNHSLAVLSSNAVATIRRILTEAGIAQCFSHVFSGDVELDKRASVRRFLTDQSYAVSRACSPAYREADAPALPQTDEVVLVTDTVGDVRHARECGIRAVGVAWGMHTEQQLTEAGAEFVAIWPQELVAHLLPGGFNNAACGCAPGSSEPSCACPLPDATPSSAAIIEASRPASHPMPLSAKGVSGPDGREPSDALAAAASVRRERILAAAAGRKADIASAAELPQSGVDPMLLRAIWRTGPRHLEPGSNASSAAVPAATRPAVRSLPAESLARLRHTGPGAATRMISGP